MATRLRPRRPAFRALSALALGTVLLSASAPSTPIADPRVLVFSKTAGFRHSSIPQGLAAIRKLGAEQGFAVDATEDAGAFTDANLKRYRAVVFLSTTGDVLDPTQESVFERYIQAGGGWVGIHSATDTEYQWPWYGRLAGAWFTSHPNDPNVRKGTFRVLDSTHVSTQGLPVRWEREDEFYNFKSIDSTIHVLVDIDETSYQGGTNGARHPMSWYHEFDGGRAWYTNMGHTESTFSEPLFLKHLAGGLRWAMGSGTLDYARARPEENRFTKVVLAEKLEEPVELAMLPGERVLFIERRGAIKLWTPATKRITRIGSIPVSLKYANGDQAEDGLLGLAADPGFARNGFVYMYYSPEGTESKNVLARFTMRGDSIDMASRKVLLEIPVQREQCCHTGGSIAFDGQGNLFLSTGDNSNPFATGYAPIDERPGRSPWDAQKSSANTNDLRGKILRIHPEPDGSYTIPAGNLFAPGTAKTRPEIYTMGHRNPYRIFVDRHTGVLYWGDVGPDAAEDSAGRGPMGHDEMNRAPKPGNYGWPYFVADNKAYFKVDYATMTVGARFDPAHPINDSPNNTGLRELPPAQPAYIWYPSGPSKEFPLVATGGRTAMAGPVFYRSDFANAPRAFPQWYDGKLFVYDWMRGWILAVTMDAQGAIANIERFMPSTKFSNPIDMEFASTGDLYMLEYGTGWFQGNPDARLVRIEYNAGNRAPVVAARADHTAGALPMRVALSAAGTADADGDSLRYEWTVTRPDGSVLRRLAGRDASVTLTQAGRYTASLAVTDAQGSRSTASIPIAAGNEPPTLAVDIAGGNRSFYFPGVPLRYAVRVRDREDGTLAKGIAPERVRVTADYVEDASAEALAGHRAASAGPHAEGRRLVEAGTCLSCHQVDRKSIGPAYTAVATRYRGDATAQAKLARKIRSGGSGVWGKVMMPPHPQLTEAEATEIAAWVLGLADTSARRAALPARGSWTPPAAGATKGAVVLRAEYTDRGAAGLPGVTAETTLVLRAPTVVLAGAELSEGVQKMTVPQMPVDITLPGKPGSYAKLASIDLGGLSAIVVTAMAPSQYGAAGGKVEIHLDSPSGPLVGETPVLEPSAQGAPTALRAPLKPTTGTHDLFFVFRDDAGKGGQMLFVVTTVTFEGAGGASR